MVPQVVGEPIAVAFAGDQVVVQSREPALLSVPGGAPITLSTESRADTGHAIFHANAGGSIACASCHAEGNDDGRVWNFTCEGPRRTQSLQVGLKGTEPFHWDGVERDFSMLVRDVFVGRMSGPELRLDQMDATLHWIDAQPRMPHSQAGDAAAIARGRDLFNDPKRAACGTCHNGPLLTNSQSVDVGTGGKFQVPSLVGIGSRGPFMHDGCAETLRDRFGACGGGDKHGVTSKLKPTEIDDMIAFMNTL
jgi:cytochrome c peroxidase